jgi:hypothetical protein
MLFKKIIVLIIFAAAAENSLADGYVSHGFNDGVSYQDHLDAYEFVLMLPYFPRAHSTCPDNDGDRRQLNWCGGSDCDDFDPNRYPGRLEVCDDYGHDEDCNSFTFGHRDNDRDGFVDSACRNYENYVYPGRAELLEALKLSSEEHTRVHQRIIIQWESERYVSARARYDEWFESTDALGCTRGDYWAASSANCVRRGWRASESYDQWFIRILREMRDGLY